MTSGYIQEIADKTPMAIEKTMTALPKNFQDEIVMSIKAGVLTKLISDV